MPVIIRKPKSEGLLTPAGVHQAVCYGVWDIGLQKQEWKGETKWLYKIVVSWEINEIINVPGSEYNGKRYVIHQFYTNSFANKANLKRDLESWRGRPFTPPEMEDFDMEALIGANCQLQIVHKETEDRTYANIQSIMPIAKGTAKMTPENTPEAPDWVKDKMRIGEENANKDNEAPQSFQNPPPKEPQVPVEHRCRECGEQLVNQYEREAGLCKGCDLPF